MYNWNIAAGLLAQLSSIIDGVDGSLARLKSLSSAFGGFLDSILDRYADILIILGLTIWSVSNEVYPYAWLVGFLSITGTLGVSYSRARISPDFKHHFDRGFLSLASRDIRLFLIMIGAIVGQGYFCLIVIAALTHLVIISRLIFAHRHLR
jgi:CDP-L-myo-inositol myo-inositolphosphotransferase